MKFTIFYIWFLCSLTIFRFSPSIVVYILKMEYSSYNYSIISTSLNIQNTDLSPYSCRSIDYHFSPKWYFRCSRLTFHYKLPYSFSPHTRNICSLFRVLFHNSYNNYSRHCTLDQFNGT